MKKIYLIIATVVFLAFIFFGFKAASSIFAERTEIQNNNITTPQSSFVQSNYLLVLVNDLTADKPQLISLWGVLNYPSNPPRIVFFPLYPTTSTETNREISSAFDLSSTNKLPGRSIGKLEDAVDLSIDGYFVSDNAGFLRFADYANLDTLEIFSKPAESFESIISVENSINSFFAAVCQLCKTGAGNSFFSKIEWSHLLPDHLSTNLSFEELMLMIDRINNSTELTTCEIVSSQ